MHFPPRNSPKGPVVTVPVSVPGAGVVDDVLPTDEILELLLLLAMSGTFGLKTEIDWLKV